MANGNPFVADRLNYIREKHKDLYDTGQFDLLLDKYNENWDYQIETPGALQEFYNYYDQNPIPFDDSEKKNPNLSVDSESDSQSEEQDTSLDIFETNKETTKLLRDYVASLEAVDGSYNSYQGSHLGDAPQYDFSSMTLKGVLDWQERNNKKAVGRYQVKPQTLRDVMKKTGMTENELYNPENQDKIFDALIKRRGYEKYLKGEGYEDFALGLAKEFAGVPLIFDYEGKSVGESYYEGQGSNRSNGDPQDLIDILKTNKAYRSKHSQDYYTRQNIQQLDDIFNAVTPDFIKEKTEEEFEIDFKKQFSRYGFDVKQAESGITGMGTEDEVIISHPDIEKDFPLRLEGFITDKFSIPTKFGTFSINYGDEPNKAKLKLAADELKKWMRGASLSMAPEARYQVDYQENPTNVLLDIANKTLLDPNELQELKAQIEEQRKLLAETEQSIPIEDRQNIYPSPYGPQYKPNPEYEKIELDLRKLENKLLNEEKLKGKVTREFQALADKFGGLEEAMKSNPELDAYVTQFAKLRLLDTGELKINTILIDGRASSHNELKRLTEDPDMREAIFDGEVNVKIIEDHSTGFEGTGLETQAKNITRLAARMFKRNTYGVASTDENPLVAFIENRAAKTEFVLRSVLPSIMAGTIDIAANLGETFFDIGKILYDIPANIIPDKFIKDADKVRNYLDDKTAAHYDTWFDTWRSFAQNNIRSVIPETAGDLASDSESLTEFFQKGSTAAGESMPYFLAFMANPAVGLGTVGLSAYGGSLEESYQNQIFARDLEEKDIFIPSQLQTYLDQSTLSQRGIAVSKSALETATTYAFTFKYFKNLAKITKPGMDIKAFREAAREYRRGFLESYGYMTYKAGKNESIEELLVSIENNAVDHIFGIRDVTFEDYWRDAKNAAGHALFSSTAMGLAGQHAKRTQARDLVETQIFNTVRDRNTSHNQLYKNYLQVQNKIKIQAAKKGTVNKTLEQQHDQLKNELELIEADLYKKLNGADREDLIEFAKGELQIANIIDNLRSADTEINLDEVADETKVEKDNTVKPSISNDIKDRAVNRIRTILINQQEIMKKIDPQNQYKASDDLKNYLNSILVEANQGDDEDEETETVSEETVSIDPQNEYTETLSKETETVSDEGINKLLDFDTATQNRLGTREPVTDQDKKYRNGAEILKGLRSMALGRIAFNENETPLGDTFFSRAPQDVQNIIRFLENVTEDDLNIDEKRKLNYFMSKLTDVKSYEDIDKLGLSKFANEFQGSFEILNDIFGATPSEFVGKKVKPMSVIEKSFVITGFADIRHLISMMFKNSAMAEPMKLVNSRIDVSMQTLIDEGIRIKKEYESLSWLDEKVDFDTYFSDENQIERHLLAHLGKFENRNREGQQKIDDRNDQFTKKVKSYQTMIDNMADENSNEDVKNKQKAEQEVFDRLLSNASTYDQVVQNAKSYNNKGVQWLRNLFLDDAKEVFAFMRNMYGTTPTEFENYLPTVLTGVKGQMNQIATDYSVLQAGDQFGRTSPNLKKAGPGDEQLAGTLSFENYEQVIIDYLIASRMQMQNMGDVFKLKGLFESKGFSDLFEPGQDFVTMRDMLVKILGQKVQRMNRVSTNERIKASTLRGFERLGSTIVKMTSARRLGSLTMRPRQYYSATFAALPVLGGRSAQFLTEQIALFTVGLNTETQRNAKFRQALISASLTKGRSGLSKTGMEPLYNLKFEKPKTIKGKIADNLLNKADFVTDKVLQTTLSNTDILAAQNTFLAFYMDYAMKRNPSLQSMTDNEFFEYAASNIDQKAVAYADEQVARSQTQSDEWNSTGIYGQGRGGAGIWNSSNTKQIIANMFFTFGRFQNNRKVGVANDMAILNSDIASESDKAVAARRLVSAAIEIGVFKATGPMVGAALTAVITPLLAELLGFDEELDVLIKQIQAKQGVEGADEVRAQNEFVLSKYGRNVSKEFGTSLFDGFVPAPIPPIISEFGFAAINRFMESAGMEPYFNVYNPRARSLFSDDDSSTVNTDFLGQNFMNSLGIYTMATEDLTNAFNSIVWLSNAKFPAYRGSGKDRYVYDIAAKGADVLAITTFFNLMFPSADLNTFNRKLRGKLERDYTTSMPSQRGLKRAKKKQDEIYDQQKRKQKQEERDKVFTPQKKAKILKGNYELQQSLNQALDN